MDGGSPNVHQIDIKTALNFETMPPQQYMWYFNSSWRMSNSNNSYVLWWWWWNFKIGGYGEKIVFFFRKYIFSYVSALYLPLLLLWLLQLYNMCFWPSGGWGCECLEVVSKTWRRNSIEIKLSASSGWPIFFAASYGQEWDEIEFNSQHIDRRNGWHDIPNKWWWRRWEWMIWYVGHMCDFRSHWPDSSSRICLS